MHCHVNGATVAAVELNEAFAAQTLACLDGWGVDHDIVNTSAARSPWDIRLWVPYGRM